MNTYLSSKNVIHLCERKSFTFENNKDQKNENAIIEKKRLKEMCEWNRFFLLNQLFLKISH